MTRVYRVEKVPLHLPGIGEYRDYSMRAMARALASRCAMALGAFVVEGDTCESLIITTFFLDRHTNSLVSPSTFATKLLEAGVTLTCSTVGYLKVSDHDRDYIIVTKELLW